MSPLHRSITLALLFVCGVAVPANAQFPLGPFLTSSPNPSFEGEPVTFTVHQYYYYSPGITLTVDGVSQATVFPFGGEAMFTTSSLKAGLHIVTATYVAGVLQI